ncbi:PriCT-2 domain-containing protein [Burkholderia pseudomallei]|uniref:PriCT-2 domain-containing protein n=2 Tax=Burkholderia pseudomallei TaxID=28450 RepID=UPI000A1A0ACC|nr:PriCT-2 domain-containing protein [Burkholderia pseudomallei]ARK97225.1 hypothetical protein BOC43_23055 [Burkholderia pseudomallei]
MSEFERASVVLGYVPADDRDTWRQAGMALKAEFGEEGFTLWNEWSQGAQNYNGKDARDVWKSFKGGKITINTLFHLAKQGGFDPRAHRAKSIDPAQRERQHAERAAREAAELATLTEKQQAASALAESIWSAAEPAPVDHPYLVRKRIPADALRVYRGNLSIGTAACDSALVIPARDADGTLRTLEFILTDGQKRYLPNGRKAGCFSLIGDAVSSVLLIGEGYATCATLAAATGHPAAVAFDAGNLHAVATALRGQYPDARIVVCADDDHTTKGNPGVTKARAAADAVAGIVAVPDFGLNRPAAEDNKPMKGGIEVRLPAIPAEVGEMGVVEKLHGFPTPAALIEHLERHAGMHYGTAGPAFIEWASSQAGELAEHLRMRVDELVGQWVPDGSHSQVARVAKRFCLVAVAGELATAHGLTGWPQGEAVEAARRCFEGWLELRGGTGNSDEAEAVRQVQHFLAAHGDNRFVWMNRAQDDHRPNVPHRAGFKQHVKRDERRTPIASDREYYAEFGGKMSADDAESVETEYLIEAAVFRKDVCAGFDHKIVAKALMKRGVLMPRSDGYPYRQEYIPGHGKFMVYRVLPSIFTLEL